MTTVVNPDLLDEIRQRGDFDATACMNCGLCTAVCPMGIDALPRRLFHQVVLGMRDRLLDQAETVYSCLLCGACEAHCPAGVHIAENVRVLRGYLNHHLYGL
jgi:heterodisulfide reductase subunit C